MLGRKTIKDYMFCYLWISPFFILFAIFTVYPTIHGFYISLLRWSGYEPAVFIGLENYARLIKDQRFWDSFLNTIILWLYIVPLRTILALILASIVCNPKVQGSKTYSFVMLLPYVTAVPVVAIIFRMILITNGGAVNVFLDNFAIGPIGWLDTTEWSKVSVALMNIWRVVGYFAIIMLAGIRRIPRSLYEAAYIDGATSVQSFLRITIPQMTPVIFYVILMSTVWLFQNVADVMVLTQGGPMSSSTSLIYYMYLHAFNYSNLGYSAAISVIIFIFLMIISVISISRQDRKL